MILNEKTEQSSGFINQEYSSNIKLVPSARHSHLKSAANEALLQSVRQTEVNEVVD